MPKKKLLWMHEEAPQSARKFVEIENNPPEFLRQPLKFNLTPQQLVQARAYALEATDAYLREHFEKSNSIPRLAKTLRHFLAATGVGELLATRAKMLHIKLTPDRQLMRGKTAPVSMLVKDPRKKPKPTSQFGAEIFDVAWGKIPRHKRPM